MAQENNFEELATELYGLLGHQVERVIKRGSRTSDLIIKANNGERWIARCEQSGDVTDSIVRDFFQVLALEKAKQAAIITSGAVTPQARELVKGKPVHLLDSKQFQDYLRQARDLAQKQAPQTPKQIHPPIRAKPVEAPPVIQPQHILTQEVQSTTTPTKKRALITTCLAALGLLIVACICLTIFGSIFSTGSHSSSVVGTWRWDRRRGNDYDGVYYIRFRDDGMVTYCGEDENPGACDWTANKYTVLNDTQIRIYNIGNGRMSEFIGLTGNDDVIQYRVTEDTLTLFRLGEEEIYLKRVD